MPSLQVQVICQIPSLYRIQFFGTRFIVYFSELSGVLDAEELSSMITKPDKKEKHMLPGIQEDLTGSTESISTLQSDCLTLESNEDDLFMDIRASIQRSSKKASNFTNSSRKLPAMVLDGTALSCKQDVSICDFPVFFQLLYNKDLFSLVYDHVF